MKRILSFFCIFTLCLMLSACSPSNGDNDNSGTTTIPVTGSTGTVDPEETFTDRDTQTDYDENGSVTVTLNGDTISSSSRLTAVDGSTITLKGAGTFVFSGTLSDGSIVVDADKTDKLQIVFDGVQVTSSTGCALYIKQADKVFLTLQAGSTNTLSNSGDFVQTDDNNVDAVLFSKEDLTLNGKGQLTVNAAYGHGIVSKDDLVITGGSYIVTAASHGLTGKDCVKIADSSFTIISGKDGIHAENNDDTTLGSVYIGGGTFVIDAETDGISAGTALQINGGSFTITTGGGSANASTDQGGNARPGWGMWGGGSSSSSDTASAKGLKAGEEIVINGGTFAIDSSDDSIHCNGSITVNDGVLTMTSGDDGIHADDDLLLAGGTVTVTKSYEGAEAQRIAVTGGTVSITASDDGFNAAGGSDGSAMGGRPGQGSFGGETEASLTFAGGNVTVNAAGDGLDSNGDLTVTGGTIYVSGPTDGGNGALDYGERGTAAISGGVLVAAGSTGMAENFGSSSTQGCILYSFSSTQNAGTTLTLTDEDGTVLVSFAPEKRFGCAVISAPGLEKGGTYTLTAGNNTYTIELTSLIWSNGNSGFGGGGGFGGGFGR